ncbi:prepilin-type N-terminal cleavage/methylation domain-containing protein [Psychrobacillus sp. FJAT-51614]|uniref:Prepilin-type N-terminal cleavage/methylation domain-containing protein n=1 Tax=Psychrobacillus mangrovi TaxID=3117745 RepID=A0ABU8F5B8_9BACI
MKKFNKILKNQKGLTLIELLAVIVILAIVAAIAVPAIGNIISNSRDKAILADASNILAGAKLAVIDNKCDDTTTAGTISCDQTVLEDYVEGITGSGITYSAAKTSDAWSVTYSKFDDIKGTDYKTGLGTSDTTMSETELNTNLNN